MHTVENKTFLILLYLNIRRTYFNWFSFKKKPKKYLKLKCSIFSLNVHVLLKKKEEK